jgi:hypothetical protein
MEKLIEIYEIAKSLNRDDRDAWAGQPKTQQFRQA